MGGVISPLLCAALTLLLHAAGAQQGWVEAPDGVVAANTEAQCAASHATADGAPVCRRCGRDGVAADSPRSFWDRQDPGGDCKLCCDEMKTARSIATGGDESELAVDESTEDIGDAAEDSAKLLAGCCEGQCCESYAEPAEKEDTGRYIALAAILVLGGIAAAMHYCHRECQVTKRQEILAAQNQQMMQQPGSAATYQVDGQVPMMSQHHHQHSLMMPQQQQQQTVMMAIPPELAHAQVVTGEVLPGQPFAQQQQPPPPPVAQGP